MFRAKICNALLKDRPCGRISLRYLSGPPDYQPGLKPLIRVGEKCRIDNMTGIRYLITDSWLPGHGCRLISGRLQPWMLPAAAHNFKFFLFAFLRKRFLSIEPQQRTHSPQLAAGLASEYKIRLKVLTVESRRGGTAACCRVLQYLAAII